MRNWIFWLSIATVAPASQQQPGQGAGDIALGRRVGGASIQLHERPSTGSQTFLELRDEYAFEEDGLENDPSRRADDSEAGEDTPMEASFFDVGPFLNQLMLQGRNNLVANQMAARSGMQQQQRQPAMVELTQESQQNDEVEEAEEELVGMGMIELLDDEDLEEDDL